MEQDLYAVTDYEALAGRENFWENFFIQQLLVKIGNAI